MLRAYLDESGHQGKGWVFVAGFIGHKDNWGSFVDPWLHGLGPQRKSLHMTALRWKRDSTRRLLERLGPIPEACGLVPIFGGVRVADYEDLVVGTRAQKLTKGYVLCLAPLVIQALRATPHKERIEFVFEQQREYSWAVELVMEWATLNDNPIKMCPDGRPRIAKWGFVPKGSTIATDPADYLAFALRELNTAPDEHKAQWCQPILKSGRGIGLVFEKQMAREMVARLRQLLTQVG